MIIFFNFFLISSIKIYQHEEQEFLNWMRKSDSIYIGEEYSFRLGVFLSNKRYIQEFNKKSTFQLSLNNFACYTPAEYRSLLTKPKTIKPHSFTKTIQSRGIPDEIDWRKKGIINPIRNQGGCGSGWAFSAICAQESQWALQKEELLLLSPQNLLDCCWKCEGCEDGQPDTATYYVLEEQNGKWMLENDYEYEETARSNCKFDSKKSVSFTKKILNVQTSHEDDMKAKCAEFGVLSAQIDASLTSFEWYSGGVYDEPDCNPWNLCHSINVVGYGIYNGIDYWLIRNSWGNRWGIDGYGMMSRNKNGQCGIDMLTFVPLVE